MRPIPADEIDRILSRVERRPGDQPGSGAALRGHDRLAQAAERPATDGVHLSVEQAVVAAKVAFERFQQSELEARRRIIIAFRASMLQ